MKVAPVVRMVSKLFTRPLSRPVRRAARLGMETLEDRTVPACFVVNTNSDYDDVVVAEGDLGNATLISLRAALNLAGASGEPSTIGFSPSVFGSGGTIQLTRKLSSDYQPVTINGLGANLVVISGGQTQDGVFSVGNSTILTINSVSLVNGNNIGSGGGITNNGQLTLNGVTISNCVAATGGGLYSTTSVTMTNCTVTNNHAIGGNGFGGGLDLSNGTATITSTTITNNDVTGRGGGVCLRTTVNVTMSDCQISDNSATHGGGIYVSGGQLAASDTAITDNVATEDGGGVQHSGGTSSFTDVNITGNMALGNGGGIYIGNNDVYFSGGIIESCSAVRGGGIYAKGATEAVFSGTAVRSNLVRAGDCRLDVWERCAAQVFIRGKLTDPPKPQGRIGFWLNSVAVINSTAPLADCDYSVIVVDGDIDVWGSVQHSVVIASGEIRKAADAKHASADRSVFAAGGDIASIMDSGGNYFHAGGRVRATVRAKSTAVEGQPSLPFGVRFLDPSEFGIRVAAQNGGIQVMAIAPDSVFARHGIEDADIIVRVEGEPVDTLPAFRRALRQGVVRESLELTIRRGDLRLTRIVFLDDVPVPTAPPPRARP